MTDIYNSYNDSKYNHSIDYMKIAKAINYYQENGFKYVEVPWDTPEEYRRITFTGTDFSSIGDNRYLVGSSEQSFIYLYDLNLIPKGSYITCSPCFRGDDIDETHQKYFMKAELFETLNTSVTRLFEILEKSKKFFNLYIPSEIIQTSDFEYDICSLSGIELGSYGIREYNSKNWIYGTAIAEPRLSKAVELFK